MEYYLVCSVDYFFCFKKLEVSRWQKIPSQDNTKGTFSLAREVKLHLAYNSENTGHHRKQSIEFQEFGSLCNLSIM